VLLDVGPHVRLRRVVFALQGFAFCARAGLPAPKLSAPATAITVMVFHIIVVHLLSLFGPVTKPGRPGPHSVADRFSSVEIEIEAEPLRALGWE
jgi:hypothetical protein